MTGVAVQKEAGDAVGRGRRGMIIFLIVLAAAAVIFFLFAWWMAGFVMAKGTRHTLEESLKWQADYYDLTFYEELEKEDYIVKGYEDYELHVHFLKNPVPTDKYMILTHGYTDTHIGSLKYVKNYLELGFHCIVYDLRGHGENEAACTTYGVYEAQDLMKVIGDTEKRFPELKMLGLHGESLGAATTLTCLKYKPKVDFAVADCPFSDIENVLRGAYRSYHLPAGLVNVADFGSKMRYRLSILKMRPIDSLDENEVPILFMHGADDTFIVPKNSYDCAARTKGYSEVWLFEKAPHAMSVLIQPKEYREKLEAFLKNHVAGYGE